MSRVLVTGGTGFIGAQLCAALMASGFRVRAAVRPGRSAPAGCAETVTVGRVDGDTDWSRSLEAIDGVVHLAARAHVTGDSSSNAKEYFATNADGSRALAAQSARMGVRRFLYLSSIKVNGQSTSDRPFSVADEVHPDGVYGQSKWLGEQYVRDVAASSGMECAIIRAPLVYGPGVKANFLALMRWIDKGWPLPLGAIRNARSLVSSWNLIDLIITLLHLSRPADGTWMVSDGHDLSTPALIELIATAMGRRARLFGVPPSVLSSLGVLGSLGGSLERLCGSLTVDISETVRVLGWNPPVRVEDAIDRTVRAYLMTGAV